MRDLTFDLTRGLSIYFVVLGHCFLYLFDGVGQDFVLNKILSSFRVPLFMFVSGYLNYGSFDGSLFKLKRRFINMIIPFLSWSVFYILYDVHIDFQEFSSRIINLFIAPQYPSPIWFLLTLFIQLLILYFCMKISKKYDVFLAFGVFLLLVVVSAIGFNAFSIKSILSNNIYFLLGYGIHKYKIRETRYFDSLCKCLILVFLILTITRELSIDANTQYASIMFKARSISGIFGVFYLIHIASRYRKWHRLFLNIGTKTLEIYTTHYLVLFILSMVYARLDIGFSYILIFVTSFIALYLTLEVSKLIKKNRILAFMMYGKMRIIPKTEVEKTDLVSKTAAP